MRVRSSHKVNCSETTKLSLSTKLAMASHGKDIAIPRLMDNNLRRILPLFFTKNLITGSGHAGQCMHSLTKRYNSRAGGTGVPIVISHRLLL